MFNSETASRLFAAVSALALSAAVFATTIIPATPGLEFFA
ncbi:enoyl-CoA hydratase [Altererythrobacter sp. GH1-8]